MQLRPYQTECIDAVEEYWREHPRRNAAVSLPTGAGKTVIMSAMAKRAVDRGERVAIIVNRDELVAQTVDKLRAADPLMMVGVVKAQKNNFASEVVVCSVQTLRRPGRAEKILPRDLVIYDEAHGSAADSSVEVMRRLGAIGSAETRAVGFSATFYRADGKPLDVIWDDVVYEKDILWAVTQGFLSDAKGISVPIRGLDLDSVKMSGGDYQDRDLGQKMLDAHAASQIAVAFKEYAPERKAICFAPTIAAAEAISEELREAGVAAETVTGSTPALDRRAMYERLQAGKTRVLCSVAVLTEGFDEPSVDCVIMARPTRAQGLYIQCVGRGLRLSPGKTDCLILDMTGSGEDNSLVGVASLAGKEKRDGDESLRTMAGNTPDRGPQGLRANLRAAGEFDPFARQRLSWSRTPGGVEFVSVKGGDFVFLHGGKEAARIGLAKGRSTRGNRDGKWLQEVPLPMEFAKPLAEAFADEIGVFATAAEIRKRRGQSPSVAQIGYAESLGVDTEGKDSAQLMREIDVARAHAVLD